MPTLGAAAAMKGGILSRALAGSRSFNGGYSSVYSGASKSNFRVTSTQAAHLPQEISFSNLTPNTQAASPRSEWRLRSRRREFNLKLGD